MAVIILFDGVDIVDSKGIAVAYTIVEYFKAIPIVPVQPVVSANPQKAIVVLAKTDHCIVRQPLLYAEVSDGYIFGEKGMRITYKKKGQEDKAYGSSPFFFNATHLAEILGT